MHPQLIDKQAFPLPGMLGVIQQAAPDPLRVGLANIDRLDQPPHVVRGHPPVLDQLAPGMGDALGPAHCAPEILHGQFGQGQGVRVEGASSALTSRPHRVDKCQQQLVRVIARCLWLVPVHLPTQGIGRKIVQAGNIVVKTTAIGLLIGTGQGRQMAAISETIRYRCLPQPLGQSGVEAGQIPRIELFCGTEHGRGIGNIQHLNLQGLCTHRRLGRHDCIQMTLKQAQGLSLHQVAFRLIKYAGDRVQLKARGHIAAPALGKAADGRISLNAAVHLAVKNAIFATQRMHNQHIRGQHLPGLAPGHNLRGHTVGPGRAVKARQSVPIEAVGVTEHRAQYPALPGTQVNLGLGSGQQLLLDDPRQPDQTTRPGLGGLIPVPQQRFLQRHTPALHHSAHQWHDPAYGLDLAQLRMGGSHANKTLVVRIVVVVQRLLAGDMFQQHITQQPIAGLLKGSTVRGHRLHQPGVKDIEDLGCKRRIQLLEQ